MARSILQAHFEVRSMLLASTLYYAEKQLTYLYEKGMLLVGSLLAHNESSVLQRLP